MSNLSALLRALEVVVGASGTELVSSSKTRRYIELRSSVGRVRNDAGSAVAIALWCDLNAGDMYRNESGMDYCIMVIDDG